MARMMTREGYMAIEAEITRLWTKERPEVTAQVSAAAELGDRSENAEYIYGKKRLREIDAKLEKLRKRADGLTIVDLERQPNYPDVRFGAIVEVEDDDGNKKTYRLVDQDESDPGRGRISVQSPIGRALLGRKKGDVVEVTLPKGRVGLEVLAVRYGGGPP